MLASLAIFLSVLAAATGVVKNVALTPAIDLSGEITPRSAEWYELCANQYKSFNPQSGLWRDAQGKYHRCRFRKRVIAK